MRFRQSFSVADLTLHPDGVVPLQLQIQLTGTFDVTLGDARDSERATCLVETERAAGRRTSEAFEFLARDELPPGHLPRAEWPTGLEYIDESGRITGRHVVPRWVLPQGLRDFADEISRELHTAAQRAVGALRWRAGLLGPPRPFSSSPAEWSLDGEQWHSLPGRYTVLVHEQSRLEMVSEVVTELQHLIDAGLDEPLAHELFREAWSQQHTNPRSAMLIAMTALEIGIKHYISACVPDARWLAENAPSPPVHKMLVEYIPGLTSSVGMSTGDFDKEVLDEVQKAVKSRNDLAHRGAGVPHKRLAKTLRAVRNILWTFDIAEGQEWAEKHMFSSLEDSGSTGYKKISS